MSNQKEKTAGLKLPKLSEERRARCYALLRRKDWDREAFESLAEENLNLVMFVVHRYKHCDLDRGSLISDGFIGLLKAIEGFNSASETDFVELALNKIEEEICKNFGPKPSIKNVSMQEISDGPDEESNPETSLLDDAYLISEFIAQLPDFERCVMESKYYGEEVKPDNRVAELLGCTEYEVSDAVANIQNLGRCYLTQDSSNEIEYVKKRSY